MESNPRGADWRSILLVIFALGGIVIAISSAIGIFVFIAISRDSLMELNASPLTTTLTASNLIIIGLLLLPLAWLSIQRLRGQPFGPFGLPPLQAWEWIVLPGLWLLCLTLASLFQDAPGASWYIPFLHVLSIALPIYFILRIVVNRIPLGSSQRAWGVFSLGMAFSPLVAIVAELLIFALGVLIVAVYLGFDPAKMALIENLVKQIQQARDMEKVIALAGPLLENPLALLTGLTFLSFFVPIIEETSKSLGVWFVSDRLQFPAQGFVLGALSGAGFALTESLSASLTPGNGWGWTLAVRAISGSMHMLASGLLGWGIAYARLDKRYSRLIGMMLLAMLLHATWNAGAIFSVWGGLRTLLAAPKVDFLGSLVTFIGVALLFTLTTGMVLAFFLLNRRLRASSPPLPVPVEEQL